MFAKVLIGEREVELAANAATAIRFRQVFHEDLLVFFTNGTSDGEATYVIQQLAFIMNMQAQGTDFKTVNEDMYIEWLEQFGQFDLINKAKEIVGVYRENNKTLSTPKKKAAQLKE